MNIPVQCFHHIGNRLAVHGFIVRIRIRPYRGTGSRIKQFHANRESSCNGGRVHFIERIHLAAKDVFSANGTTHSGHRTVVTSRLQNRDESVLDHLRRRLRPALIFKGSQFNVAGAENEPIVSIKMRRRNAGNEQSNWKTGVTQMMQAEAQDAPPGSST